MLGFEPRSRQHDTSMCSPLHHIGKTVAVNPKKVPSLCSLVTEEVATYILQPVDWFYPSVVRSSWIFTCLFGLAGHGRRPFPPSELALRVFH